MSCFERDARHLCAMQKIMQKEAEREPEAFDSGCRRFYPNCMFPILTARAMCCCPLAPARG